MFGWRKRVGYISPGALEISVRDFYLIAPEGVGLVGMTCPIDDWTPGEYQRNLSAVGEAAKYLASREVDFIHHAGAPMVVSQGPDFMYRLMEQMSDVSGLPASTAVYAASQALRSLEADRIAVLTPFPAETHEKVVEFTRAQGFSVEFEARMAANFKLLHQKGEREIYDWVTATLKRGPRVDAAYVPCPQWHVFELTPYLERDTAIPFVTSDSGDFWHVFTSLGTTDVRPGWGILLDRLRASRTLDSVRVG
ncbi:MAG: hypothetical protein IT307_18775 [Chloroflexi bacterium]|nr:hypothetical protein [Chloroflexota bacterium]